MTSIPRACGLSNQKLRNTFRVVVPELQVVVLGAASFAVLDPVTVEERPIQRFG